MAAPNQKRVLLLLVSLATCSADGVMSYGTTSTDGTVLSSYRIPSPIAESGSGNGMAALGDLDGDGVVGASDLGMLLASFGMTP